MLQQFDALRSPGRTIRGHVDGPCSADDGPKSVGRKMRECCKVIVNNSLIHGSPKSVDIGIEEPRPSPTRPSRFSAAAKRTEMPLRAVGVHWKRTGASRYGKWNCRLSACRGTLRRYAVDRLCVSAGPFLARAIRSPTALLKAGVSNGAISLQYIHSRADLSVLITRSDTRLFSLPF
jgi:hypothetical protein